MVKPSVNTETIKHLNFLLDIVDPYNECDEEGKPSYAKFAFFYVIK